MNHKEYWETLYVNVYLIILNRKTERGTMIDYALEFNEIIKDYKNSDIYCYVMPNILSIERFYKTNNKH